MKQWELALVASVTMAMLVMLAVVFGDGQRLVVEKLAPQVEKLYDFDPKDPGKQLEPRQKLDPDVQAVTNWEFKSWATMTYDVLSSEQDKGACQATIKIRTIKLTLGLPIKIHLNKDASKEMEAHEQGHVDICERVYNQSDEAARRAAEPVFQRQYTGNGATIEDARAEALRIASAEIAQEYQEETLKTVDDVSEIYDFLQKKPTPPSKSVDEAFNLYAKGKPRRVSSL